MRASPRSLIERPALTIISLLLLHTVPASRLLGVHVQGARLVAVGLGEPVQARQFCETLGFPVDMLYSDPSGAAYSALGFRCAPR